MVNIIIYVEGGGDNNNRLKTECRNGFREFFKKLGIVSTNKNKINIEVCGGRSIAFKDFRKRLKNLKNNEYCLLLVDSENPVTLTSKWQHVLWREGDGWKKPDNATEEHLHFMVECMETWFMADKETLKSYYGKGFDENLLLKQTNIEAISKIELENTLEMATRNTTKGKYSKSNHSFVILSKINAEKVVEQSPHAQKLQDVLKNLL